MPTDDLTRRSALLNRIVELTKQIERGAGSFNLFASQTEHLARGLDLIRNKAEGTTSSISRLNTQLAKLAASIESGNPDRISVGGARIRTQQMINAYSAELENINARGAQAMQNQYQSSGRYSQTGQQKLLGPGNWYYSRESAGIGTGPSSFLPNMGGVLVGKPYTNVTPWDTGWPRPNQVPPASGPSLSGSAFNPSSRTQAGGNPYYQYTTPVRPNERPPLTSAYPNAQAFYDPFFEQGGGGQAAVSPARRPSWYQNVSKQAKYYGFQPEELKSISTEATTGISRVQYQGIDETTGAIRNLNLAVSKSGEVISDTQRRFRTFFDGVRRDTVEFIKWSAAAGIVLGAMQGLNSVITTMIENESKLADISITLAGSQKTVGDVFEATAQIANRSGEQINTVLDAYNAAYRAVGATADPIQRFAEANTLLSDALTLSKLSTLDEAEAIDTLSASIRQTGGDFSTGTGLLDKWVRTTKVANVDLATLATGFAIVGDAADAAGLSVDELNGLLATIAETGVASGKEVANAARAMISGFQSDKAKSVLSSLGIATEQGGQTRPFEEILSQIAEQKQGGAIGGAQFNDLTLALGGGYRRQAVWATLIENYSRVGQVASESAKASGDANDALAKKTDTVQTSITRMNNAFQELAQTIGTKGGILDLFKALVETGTGLIGILNTISGLTSKAFPVALAGIGGFLATAGKNDLTKLRSGPAGIVSRLTIPESRYDTASALNNARDIRAAQLSGNKFFRGGFGVAVAALPAIQNATDESLSTGQKVGKVATDIVGGVIGGLAGGPGGAIIGVTIAEAFASAVTDKMNQDYSGTFGQIAARLQGKALTESGQPLSPAQKRLKDAEEALGRFTESNPQTDAFIKAIQAQGKDLTKLKSTRVSTVSIRTSN